MITLTTNGHNLLLVPVPKDAHDFDLDIPLNNRLWYKMPHDKKFKRFEAIDVSEIKPNTGIPYHILGTIHVENGQPVLSDGFAARRFVTQIACNDEDGVIGEFWTNYKDGSQYWAWNTIFTAEESFLSLITSEITKAGYTWGNPMGEEPILSDFHKAYLGDDSVAKWQEKHLAWRAAEEKATYKLAIILKRG